ncbi:MAG: hypothetical protein ACRCUJ_07560, partial [Phocaeicola sp.]
VIETTTQESSVCVMSPIRTEKNYEIRTLYRKEEIKEFNNKKKGAQKELSQEVDLVEIFKLVPSHP